MPENAEYPESAVGCRNNWRGGDYPDFQTMLQKRSCPVNSEVILGNHNYMLNNPGPFGITTVRNSGRIPFDSNVVAVTWQVSGRQLTSTNGRLVKVQKLRMVVVNHSHDWTIEFLFKKLCVWMCCLHVCKCTFMYLVPAEAREDIVSPWHLSWT